MPLKRRQAYVLRVMGGGTGFSPVDATTYFTGTFMQNWGTSGAYQKLFIPRAGTLRIADINTYASAATGTNEDWLMKLRLNNTTNYDVATVGLANRTRRFFNDDMNIPLTPDDYLEVTTTTPTWATNPTGILLWGQLFIEY